MPEIKTNKLPVAGQMVANADEDKKKKFLEGFTGKKAEEDKGGSGMMAAMKRKIWGGS